MRHLIRWLVTAVLVVAGFAFELTLWGTTADVGLGGTVELRWGGELSSWVALGLSAVSSVFAVLAWWRATAGFVVAVSISLALAVAVPSSEPFVAVLIALFILARCRPAAVAALGLALTVVVFALNAWNSLGWTSLADFSSMALHFVLWFLIALTTWTVGRTLQRADHKMVALERSLAEAHQAARVGERRAIARDLHDIVAHSVAGILLQAGGARALIGVGGLAESPTQERVEVALGHIESSAHQALRELHRLLKTMRAADVAAGDEGERLGGLGHIEELIAPARAAGVQVEVEENGDPRRLDRSIDLAAYRCVQEGLANAMKHAGAGSKLTIRLNWGPELVVDMLSSGDRPGWVPANSRRIPGGFGLVGLKERLDSVGGRLEARPETGGFRLLVSIPLAAA